MAVNTRFLLVQVTTVLVLCICVFACAARRGGHYPAPSPNTRAPLLLAGDDFCAFYREVKVHPAEKAAVALGRRITSSRLHIVEKAWLLFSLADFGYGFDANVALVSGGKTYAEVGDIMENVSLGCTDMGILIFPANYDEARASGTSRVILSGLDLVFEKNEWFPSGAPFLGQKPQYLRTRAEYFATSAAPSRAASEEGPAAVFCALYRQALGVEGDALKVALAQQVEKSGLSDCEKAYLGFTLLEPGMSAQVAHEIAGGDGALTSTILTSRRMRIYDEKTGELKSLAYSENKTPLRYYRNGLKVQVTDAAAGVVTGIETCFQKRN